MALDLWLVYAAACIAILISPGPTVVLLVSYGIAQGRRAAWATVPGVALADLIAMTIAMAGVGALVASSPMLYAFLRFAGGLYLIWIGISLWRSEPEFRFANAEAKNQRRLFRDAFMVTVLNPKSIVFFISFVPQFIDPAKPLLRQLTILEATFVLGAALFAMGWALAAGTVREAFKNPQILKILTRFGGTFLIFTGLAALLDALLR